jgi:hypothetical protein
MSVDHERGQRELPNKPTGLRGVKTWFFGRREYAHPALRWASMPLFRLAWIPFVIDVSRDYRSTVLFILFLTFCGVSIAASSINAVLLRRRQAHS